MPDPTLYLKASISVAIASAMIVLAFRLIKGASARSISAAIGVLAVGVGLLIGYEVLQFTWIWPPANALNRFLIIVLPATVVVELLSAVFIDREFASSHCVPRAGSNDTFGHCLIVGVLRHWHGAHADGVEVKQVNDNRVRYRDRQNAGLAAWQDSRAWASLRVLMIILRLALYACAGRILLHESVYLAHVSNGNPDAWTFMQTIAIFSSSFLVLITVRSLLSRLSEHSGSCSITLSLAMAILCTGLTTMMAGYIKGGVAAFPLTAALVGTTLGAAILARGCGDLATRYLQGTIGIGTIGLFGLLCIGHYFGHVTGPRAIVLFLTPLLCWISELPGLRSKPPWQKSAMRLIGVTIPLATVLCAAKRDFDQKMAPLLASVTSCDTEPCHRLYRTTCSGFLPVIFVTTLQTPSTISSSTSGAHPTGEAY